MCKPCFPVYVTCRLTITSLVRLAPQRLHKFAKDGGHPVFPQYNFIMEKVLQFATEGKEDVFGFAATLADTGDIVGVTTAQV